MYLLDTDHISLLDKGGEEGKRIHQRLRTLPGDDIATSIISYEEQIRGWTARIAQAPSVERQIFAYSMLKRQIRNYCAIIVEDFDEKAFARFKLLQDAKIRIGTMDLKIASIALANNMILLTRNSKDFRKVPDLRIEDWSL